MERLIDLSGYPVANVLDLLLQDKSTKKNIIWATDTYEKYGEGFTDTAQMSAEALLCRAEMIRPRIQKPQEAQAERTRKKAEVFTPAWLCNRMNNYCDEDWFGREEVFNRENGAQAWTVTEGRIEFPKGKKWRQYVDSRRLEITCGEAPYLVSRYDVSTGELIVPPIKRIGMLDRKLRIVNENADTYDEWLKWAVRALEATYGYEYQGDNVLIARINLLLTFTDYYEERWGRRPEDKLLRRAANKIAWNIWQMDGLKGVVPLGKPYVEFEQMTLFELSGDGSGGGPEEPAAAPCRIFDWRGNTSLRFMEIKETRAMGKKLFDYVIGNPPYQEETEIISKTNGQLRRKSVFHFFQMAADEIADKGSVLVYPAGRWIQKSGRGMKEFGYQQLNDKRLSKIIYYPNAKEVFPSTDIGDGISIVIKNQKKDNSGFKYIICQNGDEKIFMMPNPGEDVMPLNPNHLVVMKKIDFFFDEFNLPSLHDRIYPQKLFGIESDFVEKNPDKVCLLEKDSVLDFNKQVKLFTNDRAGKAGRAKWYITNKDCIKTGCELIHKWKVVVSSANAGGQKRDNQLAIFDNNSVFGRARLALGIFDTEEEANNFYLYMKTYLVRFAFLLTDENLGTLGIKVPDLVDYKKNKLIDFDLPLDEQLFSIAHFSDEEIDYVVDTVNNVRKKEMA